MRKRDRQTLKNYFKRGALPSEEQFSDLIESSLNMLDDGFSRSPANGIEIATHGERDRLVTFFRGTQPTDAKWSLGFRDDQDRLHFLPRMDEEARPALTVAPEGCVGVNRGDPAWALDVNGVVRAEGRIGGQLTEETSAPADGEWHDISGPLRGCNALEIMAGVGKKATGKYALMHAFALNTFQPRGIFFNFLNRKNRITYHQAYYLSRRDKLKLEWFSAPDHYRLRIRTNSDFGEGVRIRYFITRLWFDEDMSECWHNPQP